MKLNTLSIREQVLILIVATVLLGGGYTLLRGWPAYNDLKAMEAETAKTEARIKKTEIPELPDVDEEELHSQIAKAEASLVALQANADSIEHRLASPDSQELRLRISSLAQQSGVLIHENKAYVAINPLLRTATKTIPTKSKRPKKSAAPAPQQAAPTGAVIVPENESLTSRMASGTAFERPMQQLSMEGDFFSISKFILGLDRLPWQVTVVQFKLETRPVEPPAGYPQRLSASMILAL